MVYFVRDGTIINGMVDKKPDDKDKFGRKDEQTDVASKSNEDYGE